MFKFLGRKRTGRINLALVEFGASRYLRSDIDDDKSWTKNEWPK